MFRILLFSAFCLLLAAVGKFIFMDDYLPADARGVAVSAALSGASGLTDRQRDAADMFVSAHSGVELDSLFEDAVPAAGAAANLDAGARAIARDLLGGGVEEPQGAAALPNADAGADDGADDGAAAQQEASTGGTAAEPPAPVSSLAGGSAVMVAPSAPVDENTALPPPAAVAGPAGRTADVRRGESKPKVAAAAVAAASSATSRKPSRESRREAAVVEKRPTPAVAARSQAPEQVAKAERSKPVAARSTGQSAGRAAVAQSSKAGRAYQARVGMPVGRSDRKLMARLEQETRGAPARSKSEPAKRRNTSTGGGMARSTSGTDGDEIVSRWVGSVATGVQRLMGHELNSVTKPRSVVGYCRSQPDSWVFDEGRKQMVYCGEVAAARSSAAR
ncbi:MAG: hypothetical protein WAS73_03155 [Defluviicoccus sp.]